MNLRNKIRLKSAVLLWSILGALAAGTSAGTSVKTFDFGAGGDNPTFRSHSRTFAPPQSVAVAVAVNYRTSGDGAIPLIVEVEDAENKILTTRGVTAEKTSKRLIINVSAADNTIHGCEKAWQVRIKSKDGQVPPSRVFGDIIFSFVDPPAANVAVEGNSIDLSKGGNARKQIGSAESLRHPGVVNIKSSWTHNPLAQALALRFEIVRPDGSVAKSFTGYGTNSNGNPKLDFSYTVTIADTKQNGAWRMHISNNTEHDVSEIKPIVTFTGKCFE